MKRNKICSVVIMLTGLTVILAGVQFREDVLDKRIDERIRSIAKETQTKQLIEIEEACFEDSEELMDYLSEQKLQAQTP